MLARDNFGGLMKVFVGIFVLLLAGCANSAKTSVSVYFEKDLWVESDFGNKSDAKARVEYKLEQNGPWSFKPWYNHE